MRHLLNRSKAVLALLLLVMLVAPLATPLASADSNTSGRSSPDFGITYFALDGAGSVQDGADIFVENATHTAIIIVSNLSLIHI